VVGIGSALGPRGASLHGGRLTVGSVGLFRAHADPMTLRPRRVGTSVEMTVYVTLRPGTPEADPVHRTSDIGRLLTLTIRSRAPNRVCCLTIVLRIRAGDARSPARELR
jgi:hypothetical protein